MDLINKIEAILFISGKAMELAELSIFFNIKEDVLMEYIKKLKELRSETGINIKILNNNFVQLTTNALYGEDIHNFFQRQEKPKKLTKASLETLTIIAYKQPVTKLDIESIRGVNVDKVVSTLEEKKLIRICGKKNAIGSPNLYEVTDNFLAYINIKTIKELPNYKEVNDESK